MKDSRYRKCRTILTTLIGALLFLLSLPSRGAEGIPDLPYRILLVIAKQWQDPASDLVEGAGEFQTLAALLKTWGIPFDIMRLDEERFDKYHVLDRDGRPRHGTIIWDADVASMKNVDSGLLRALVGLHGVGLIIHGDAVAPSEIAALAGLQYESECEQPDPLSSRSDHFVTRGLEKRTDEFLDKRSYAEGYKVTSTEATVVLARGHLPFLTVREFQGRGRVVWLGAHRTSAQIKISLLRDLLKRCLVWTQRYAVYAEYPNSVILLMDDPGTSDKTYLPSWHYVTPSESDIRKGLIEPLKIRGAVMVLNVNAGYVDRKSQSVVNPWKQKVVDEIDGKTLHDFGSTKRGIDAGMQEGVLEVQSHGWTHMLPDLESPPGPFWQAPMDGVGSLNWYTEFVDRLRKEEIPASVQAFHLRRASECIKEDFGVTPLFFVPGGAGYSKSSANHTARIAARMGFGLARFTGPAYLGRDLVIVLTPVVPYGFWSYRGKLTAADISSTTDGPYFITLHDRDLSRDSGSIKRLLDDLGPRVRYMSANEYCAYLHAEVTRIPGSPMRLSVAYDSHYCQYFKAHRSRWVLHVSDDIRERARQPIPERRIVEMPEGLGPHVIELDLDVARSNH